MDQILGSTSTDDFCIQKNIIYTTGTDKKAHIIDRKKYKEIQQYSLPKCFWCSSPITVVKNILFGFEHHNSTNSHCIEVVDLNNNKKRNGTIRVQFDEKKRDIKNKFKLFEKLISYVKFF